MIKCRTGVIPVGAGSVNPARAYFLHDYDGHTPAEALKCTIWLSWAEYAESNRAGEHIGHLQPCQTAPLGDKLMGGAGQHQ